MARSKYYSETAKKRTFLEVITIQVCADKVKIELSKSHSVGSFSKVTEIKEKVENFPVGMAMMEMLQIIEEMEAAFICATGKNYSCDEASKLIFATRHKEDRESRQMWQSEFYKKAKRVWETDLQEIYYGRT